MNAQEPIRVIIENNNESLLDYLSNPNAIIAITAILVSLLGLILSVRYSRKTIRITQVHNKKSVEPYLNPITNLLNNNEVFSIVNKGFGPAVIVSIEFIIEGKRYKTLYQLYQENVPDFLGLTKEESVQTTNLDESFVIGPKEEVSLFSCQFRNRVSLDTVNLFSKKVEYIIKYKSIYDDVKECIGTVL